MRVEVAGEVFAEDGTGFEHIIMLMQYFAESRHEWVINFGDPDLVVGYFRQHAPIRAQTYGLMAQKGLVSQAWAGGEPRSRPVMITADSLTEHVEDLGRPAQVVVENQQSDRAFVLALAHVFATDKIVEADEKGWLEFAQAGGSGEVPKVVAAERARFRRVARVAFLLDSDRMVPGSTSKHEKTADGLRDLGVPGHVLVFREAENYVPNKILAAVSGLTRAELAKRIAHLKDLTPDQRAYFDFKTGFWNKKKCCLEISPEQQELYESLSERMVQGLGAGFGEKLSRLLEREAKAGNLQESDFAALGSGVCEELRGLLALLREIV
ncbi:hypothetical protein AB0G15_42060 [Streptosporangium sp. NPDC023825]|uniref:hypothetical protein n=1 Tax=Streptosporangium sp. NPDC023825 TaxID=3154909 RepID=UPI003420F3EA